MKINNLSTSKEQIRHYSSAPNARRALAQLQRRANVRTAKLFKTTVTDRRRKDYGELEYGVYVLYKAL